MYIYGYICLYFMRLDVDSRFFENREVRYYRGRATHTKTETSTSCGRSVSMGIHIAYPPVK